MQKVVGKNADHLTLFFMASFTHGAALTAAAAGGFPLLFISHLEKYN